MKFSEAWLREWVNPKVTTDELSHQLTMAGLEVDAVEPVAGEFSKVVVGEVIKVEKHPDADKLNVCEVNVGDKEALQIVCGAANVREGLKVPAALVGAKLPGDFKIKKSKLRGVPSHGMLCSEKELGLAESAEGLMELPVDAPVGTDFRDYLKLDDVSIELGLTPNRGDCLSIAGIARETGVLNEQDVTGPEINPVSATIKNTFGVTISAEQDCPRYAGRVIKGINPNSGTPVWMQEKLRRCGVRSLGPVVDVTNYVLLELGQPMHAFDLAKLDKGIQVRHASQGEKLTLLDGQEVQLSEGTLVIADESKPVALAGIMGGADSAVGDDTVDIFLESAYFNPLAIAGRARSYGLHTDSSHRFERGVSPDLQVTAIERATSLLLDIVGGEAGPVTEVVSKANIPVRSPVNLRESRVARVLGAEIPADTITEILTRLGLAVEKQQDGWLVTPPAFRFDITLEVDLIEEIGRIYSYDNLPETRPLARLSMVERPEGQLTMRQIRRALVDMGYQEAITYSFVDPKLQKALDPEQKPVELANPISSDMSVMRTSLWPGLVQSAIYNLHRQQNRLSLFESGLRFVKQGTELKQELMLAGLITGLRNPEQWAVDNQPVDFFDLKGQVENLLEMTGCKTEFSFARADNPVLHPGQSAQLMRNGIAVGWIGALHPGVEKQLGLSQRVFVFEITASALMQAAIPSYTALSKYPAIRRDIALLVDKSTQVKDVVEIIKNSAPEALTNIELFDVYEGEGIDSGRKSLALGLTLQDLSRTLTDKEIEQTTDTILKELKTRIGAVLRE
ncbi:MAG: phenylalanine--tRNA ligase subunit beta [Gammaproteobacteria bacterium]